MIARHLTPGPAHGHKGGVVAGEKGRIWLAAADNENKNKIKWEEKMGGNQRQSSAAGAPVFFEGERYTSMPATGEPK